MAESARTLVLGIGNPLFGDDGVGIEVARRIEERSRGRIDVIEASASGIELLDIVSGYERLIIIDAIVTGEGHTGRLYRLGCGDFTSAARAVPKHQMNIFATLEFGRELKVDVPDETVVYAVEIEEAQGLKEGYTAELEDSIPGIVETIIQNEKLSGHGVRSKLLKLLHGNQGGMRDSP